jgi:lysophospholipase L1-like esterase
LRASLLTALASLTLSLVLAEAGLRLFYPVGFREPPPRSPGDRWFELLHRRSSQPGVPYELAPGMWKRSHGTVIRTNSHDMREREIPIVKPDLVTRIAVLGDSYTFGFGVRAHRAYPRRLEGLLNQRSPGGARFQALNFGVGGYSTQDEAVVLTQRALAWSPDLVVVGYVLNDPEDEPIQPLQSYYQEPRWWQRFHLLRLVAKAEWQWRVRRFGGGDYIRSLYGDPRKWKNVIDGFASIRRAAASRGIPVMVVVFPLCTVDDWAQYPYGAIHRMVARAAAADGFEVVDLLPLYARRPPRELRLGDSDAHPNDEGHLVAAEAIAARLLAGSDRFFGAAAPSRRSERPSAPTGP